MDDTTATHDTHENHGEPARTTRPRQARSPRVLANPRRSRLAAWPRVQDTIAAGDDEG